MRISNGAIGLAISTVACVLASAACGTRTGLDPAPSPCRWSIDGPHVVAVAGDSWDLQRMYVDGDRVLVRAGSTLGLGEERTQVFAFGFDGRPLGDPWLEGPREPMIGFGHAGALLKKTDDGSSFSVFFVPTDEHGVPSGPARPLNLDTGYMGRLRATQEGFTYLDLHRLGSPGDPADPELLRLDPAGTEIARVSLLSEATGLLHDEDVDFDDGGFMVFMSTAAAGAALVARRFTWDGRADAPTQVMPDPHVIRRAARFDDGAVFLTGTSASPPNLGPLFREMTTQVVALDGLGRPGNRAAVFSSHLPVAARQVASGELVVVTARLADFNGAVAAPSQVHVLSSTLSPLAKLDLARGPNAFETVKIAPTPEGAIVGYPSDIGIAVAALRCR